MTYRFKQLGTDLELFLKDSAGNPVPVCGLLGGTKANPRPILKHLREGFAVQEDNVMVEFNVPPTSDFHLWTEQLEDMKAYLSAYFEGKGNYTLCPESSMRFSPEQLQSEQAKEFGCDPDYNIWSLTQNEIDRSNPELQTLRTAGGHVHVSFSFEEREPQPPEVIHVVKALDIFLGIPSIVFDKDTMRRKIYGRAGAFRPKPYGVEYRVLSGKWFSDVEFMYWVFDSVQRAFQLLRKTPEQLEQLFETDAKHIQDTINESKIENIPYFQRKYNILLPGIGSKKTKAPSPHPDAPLQALVGRRADWQIVDEADLWANVATATIR